MHNDFFLNFNLSRTDYSMTVYHSRCKILWFGQMYENNMYFCNYEKKPAAWYTISDQNCKHSNRD